MGGPKGLKGILLPHSVGRKIMKLIILRQEELADL
jgi:hypothetical protein